MNANHHIVLYAPVIPQNTGSIARLCACTGAKLHLIRPLGFEIDDASVKRAGLDYWQHVDVCDYENWESFLEKEKPENLYFFSKFGKKNYAEVKYVPSSYLVFGSETKGLPKEIWEKYQEKFVTIPMRTNIVRSLNLSQAAALTLYEVLRQDDFKTLPITENYIEENTRPRELP